MRRLATGLVCASALGVLAVFGAACAAGGTLDNEPPPDVAVAPTEPGVKLPPKSSSSSSGEPGGEDDDDDLGGPTGDGGPTSKPDGGGTNPGLDAGPPPPPAPVAGDPCPTLDELRSASCGFCGTKKTICEKTRDGSLKWAPYSACEGQPADAVCAAGSVEPEPCGNCGTRVRTCSNACKWVVGACTVPPAAECAPATLDLTNAGCPEDQYGKYVYRVRSCRSDCSFNPYSSCISPPAALEIGQTLNTVSSTVAILAGSLARASGTTCPLTAAFGEGRAYAYTQIRNPLSMDATVSIYNSEAPGGAKIKTNLVAYEGDEAPSTADARKQCVRASTSFNQSITGGPGFAIMETTRRVTIKAGGSIMLYTSAVDANVSGSVKVNVKTEILAVPASTP
ncbi:MAG: hypothetical protein KIT84_32495 [Labilithrix sp.]|nr:hypothetical protein [Labilithrix sp.]MCW5815794.1 hypothetical protein [Labilithrix sp.]